MKKGDTYTYKFTVSPAVYNGFINLFNDRNPLHTQEDFAKSKGFSSVVMHGNILNGFISYFIGECLPEKNVMIYSQTINFKKPTYINDDLILHAQIEDVFESVKSAEIKFYFENNAKEKIAIGKVLIGINL